MSYDILNNEKPYWINPENGYVWYVDKLVTDWCTKDKIDWPKLDAICFLVCEKKDDKIEPITRVLVDKKTNKAIATDDSLEGMAVKIEALRMAKKKW